MLLLERDVIELDTVLIKVASRCNINCSYCYVYNMGDTGWASMPRQISDETIRAIARSLGHLTRIQNRSFAVVLHGGEPLLLGPQKLRYMISVIRSKLPPETALSLQTNGILISNELLDLFAETRTTVSISIDGPQHVHDRSRIGHTGQGTFDKVLEGIRRLQNHPNAGFLFSGVLAVVDPASDPEEVYNFFKELSPPSVDFLYRDGNHSRLPNGKESLQSTEYGEWLAKLLDVYLADQHPIQIRFLDDIIKLMLGGSGTKDGVGLTNYGVLIIDTDGSITKNDTLKSSFDGADRFEQRWSVHTHDLTDVLSSTEFSEYHAMQQPSSKTCLTCPELKVCGGGMALHRWRDDNGYDNPSVYCTDQKLLIGYIRRYLPLI
jgi:uncharacterized protein